MRKAKDFQREFQLSDNELESFQKFLDDPNQKTYELCGPKIAIVHKEEDGRISSLGILTKEQLQEWGLSKYLP